MLTVATGRVPPFQLAALTFAIGGSIGAVWDRNAGSFSYGGGAAQYATRADLITVFSQRSATMSTISRVVEQREFGANLARELNSDFQRLLAANWGSVFVS